MKKFYSGIIALLLIATTAVAQDKTTPPDPFHDWLTYYYMDKNSVKVPDFLIWLEKTKKLDKYPAAVPSIEGFLGIVFADNADKVDGWKHATTFTGKTKVAVEKASKSSDAIKSSSIETSGDLDRVWGAYFASGDTLYLKKITDVLGNKKPGKAYDELRAAAIVSLGGNMTQHESIDRFLQAESGARKDEIGNALKDIIATVVKQRNERAFPNHDGDFSATVLVTDPRAARDELAKSSGGVVHIREMAHVKSGESRAVLLLFAGMQLTHDYMSDVTYTLQITDPDKKTFTDEKNLEGIKQKLPTRFRIFDNKSVIFIKFDDKDPLGIYKIVAVITDNVGKKSIPLTASFTLEK